MNDDHIYIAIDLKSFYASVECVQRGLNPLTTHLVVADPRRTEKTICLAVSPSLKSYGIGGRARLFDVVERVRQINADRQRQLKGQSFTGESHQQPELLADPSLRLSYIVAPPQMALYMDISTQIHQIYLKYIAPEDMHVYSIDEVFIDAGPYLNTYGLSAHDLAMKMILEILEQTGITATAGIGTNLYLCKIAMDIMAKHSPADENGVRIAQLDEESYRKQLWDHRPMTDFWRVGGGTVKKLQKLGIYTMGDLALFSMTAFGEDKLYEIFGVNAELLIDHAWGYEPCTIAQIKSYKSESNSISSGQVLSVPYDYEMTKIIIREMTELLSLQLVDKHLVTRQMVLTVGYDTENLRDPKLRKQYQGEIVTDRYGRKIPKHSHGTANLPFTTSSSKMIVDAVLKLYEQITNPQLLVRRLTVSAEHVINETQAAADQEESVEQMDLFTDYDALDRERARQEEALAKEKKLQIAALDIKKKFGKNAILKGTDLQEGATAIERNQTIGGHKA